MRTKCLVLLILGIIALCPQVAFGSEIIVEGADAVYDLGLDDATEVGHLVGAPGVIVSDYADAFAIYPLEDAASVGRLVGAPGVIVSDYADAFMYGELTAPPFAPTPTPTPTPTSEATVTAEITNNFAEVKGDFPALFSDNDDSTYVRGGLGAPNSDYEAKFTMKVQETDTLEFNAKVNCLSGYCGGKTVCGFLFFAKNHETGEYDKFSGAPWDPPGIHEYVLTLEDASKYIRNGEVDFFFSFHCNMDGYVMEFKQMGC